MSTLKNRKPIKTYSRQRTISLNDEEPPTKRRRVEPTIDTSTAVVSQHTSSPATLLSSGTHQESLGLTSSPKQPVIFSDDAPRSTPPSSPPAKPLSSPPPPQTRRPMFSFLKPKCEPKPPAKKPLAETNHNVQAPAQPAPKKKRLIQMQIDLGGDLQKLCKVCGMNYIPSNVEDAALHKKFHAMNIGGVNLGKALTEKLKKNKVWAGEQGNFVAVISRKHPVAFRHKAREVLEVVNKELAAVEIPDKELWSTISTHKPSDVRVTSASSQIQSEKAALATGDRFKVYLYIEGQKCVGACLAERIQEAFMVLDRDDEHDQASKVLVRTESSSITVSNTGQPVLLGISRIWTSNLQRHKGIATTLLDSARSDFLYGMVVPKAMVAFSQPTESGGRLARKWYGRQAGWPVYRD